METKVMTSLVLKPSPYVPGGDMIKTSQFSHNERGARPGPGPHCCSAHGELSDCLLSPPARKETNWRRKYPLARQERPDQTAGPAVWSPSASQPVSQWFYLIRPVVMMAKLSGAHIFCW